MHDMQVGRRERKKRQTREAIVEHALRLFAERGFDATTVGDIAEAADIAPRTFFGHFATKEDVVFHDFDEVLAEFTEAIEQRPGEQTTFDALRAWVADRHDRIDFTSEAERTRHELVRTTPSLAAHEQANRARFEAVCAIAVARDLDLPEDALEVRLVSAAAVAALSALHEEELEPGDEDPLALLDTALVFLNAGLAALRER